jgi:hypothetical protein
VTEFGVDKMVNFDCKCRPDKDEVDSDYLRKENKDYVDGKTAWKKYGAIFTYSFVGASARHQHVHLTRPPF